MNRFRLQGFIILGYYPRFGEAITVLSNPMAEGKPESEATAVEGLEELPNAPNLPFAGGSTGRFVFRIRD